MKQYAEQFREDEKRDELIELIEYTGRTIMRYKGRLGVRLSSIRQLVVFSMELNDAINHVNGFFEPLYNHETLIELVKKAKIDVTDRRVIMYWNNMEY